jgi:hypothetical protein
MCWKVSALGTQLQHLLPGRVMLIEFEPGVELFTAAGTCSVTQLTSARQNCGQWQWLMQPAGGGRPHSLSAFWKSLISADIWPGMSRVDQDLTRTRSWGEYNKGSDNTS